MGVRVIRYLERPELWADTDSVSQAIAHHLVGDVGTVVRLQLSVV